MDLALMDIVKTRNCPLCGSEKKIKLWYKDNVTYAKCKECTLVYQLELPSIEELNAFYDDQAYYNKDNSDQAIVGYQNYTDESTDNIANVFFELVKIYHQTDGKNLLDIGCATGNILKIAEANGWQATGIEISDWAAGIAKKRGLNIYQKSLRSCGFQSNTFDAITLIHVLEHFSQPVEEIKEIFRILKPNGIVIIETPNIESFTTRYIYGANSILVQPHAHLTLFSKMTMKKMLLNNDFKILKTMMLPLTRTYGRFVKLLIRRIVKNTLYKIDYKIGNINFKKYFHRPEIIEIPKITLNDIICVIASKH